MRPALIVVGLAVLIVGLGSIVALLPGSSGSTADIGTGKAVAGVPLRALSAAPFVARIASNGEPPADIAGSLAVPSGSVYVTHVDADRGIDQFDRSVTFTVPATPAQVQRFYRTELRAGHWSSQFDGSAAGGIELLGQRDGSDGYQWGVGVVISKVQPALSPALAGAPQSAPTSRVVLTLYQVEDAS